MIGLNLLCEYLLEQLVTVVHEHQQETKELRARIVALEQRQLEAAAE
jgi:hypothetical protein